MRPFRFGVQLRQPPSAKQWRELCRKTEDLGFSTIFLPDHFQQTWNPIVPLTVALEVTSAMKVGALVFANDYRHPVVLARDIAAMDFLSEGRVEFGLGAGWMTVDYEQSGIQLDRPGVRIERLEEAIRVIKGLWSNDTFSFTGRHYRIEGARCEPKPHRPGGPPLLIGGGGNRVLTVAATHADIIGVNPELTEGVVGQGAARSAVGERYRERIQLIKQVAGDRFPDIELQLLAAIEMVVPNRDEVFANLAGGFGITPEEAADVPVVLCGTVEQIVDDLVRRREELGFSYVVVHEVDALAPVVAKLAGT